MSIDVENFDEYKSEGVLFDSPRSLFACRQLGITQQSLLYIPFSVFMSKAKSEPEARLREAHWRKKRMRMLADIRCKRQDNIQKGVGEVEMALLAPGDNHLLPGAAAATPSYMGTPSVAPSASIAGHTPRSILSSSTKFSRRSGDPSPGRPRQFNMNHIETYVVDKPAVYRREEQDIERRKQLLDKIQKKENTVPERQQLRRAIRGAPAAEHNQRWEKKRDEAFQAKLDREIDDLRANLKQQRERDALLERQLEEKSRAMAEKRAERAVHTKLVKQRTAQNEQETSTRIEEKLERAEERRRERLRQEEEARVVRAMENEVKNEKRHQRLLEKIAQEEDVKAKAEARRKEFEQHVSQVEDARREHLHYMKLVNQEKHERKAAAYKQSVMDQQLAKEKQLAKLHRQAEEVVERTQRAQQQQAMRAVEKELAFQEKEEAAQQAKRRAQFEAEMKGVRLKQKMQRIDESRVLKMMEMAEHRTNLHKMHIAKSKLAPLEQPMFPTAVRR